MPARILLVDDDVASLQALFDALVNRLDDVAVDTARDSHVALDFLRNWQYAAVITDIRMPGMDGLALLNQVRERWPEVPVILMTAMGWSTEAQALYDGAFAFIEKPLDVERLAALIQAAAAKAELRSRVQEANRTSIFHLDLEAGRLGLNVDPSLKLNPSPKLKRKRPPKP
jgi:DNA-binding NtrC family response regulator